MAEEPGVSQEATGNYIAQATGGGTATVNVYASPPSRSDQDRMRFLVRLCTRYSSLLSQSLQGAVRVTLELAGYPEAVTPPVQLLYQSEQQPVRPLAASISLSQVYTEAGHELLVLGDPGAGKSTQLLELAFELVKQAEQDQSLLLPVIIPLSSWATKRLPLQEWLAEQVALLYDIASRLAKHWVQEEYLLPLLDGLDEMQEEARTACIMAINAYHHEHLHPLVVASRSAEYEMAAANARLVLHSAVVVQPLTREQVDAYLVQCGEPVAALRTALRKNPILQEIATTPLMLSILILTYEGQAVSELPTTDSFPEQQRQIFARYVERMMTRKRKLMRFSPQDLASWLQWLARQMRERDQTIFYLGQLQLDWFPKRQTVFYQKGIRLFTGLALGLCVGLTIGLAVEPVYGSVGGLLGGLLFGVNMRVNPDVRIWSWKNLDKDQLDELLSYLIYIPSGLFLGLFLGLVTGVSYGLLGGLLGGLLCGLINFLRHYVIRFLLARSRAFPWHAPRFLEEATTRILLRRVGGGYSFPHRLLLDYFADLPDKTP